MSSLADRITATLSSEQVEAYDILEVTLNVNDPSFSNPFTDVEVSGEFGKAGETPVAVTGFCDSLDGSVFRIRFMPSHPGDYDYTVRLRHSGEEFSHLGSFRAVEGHRKGIVRVDEAHPFHFVWEGTGEHYFWNGTTTYFLMGWDDEQIGENIDRLHRLKVNRLRVAIAGRVESGQSWHEPVYPTERFKFTLNPWVAENPDSVSEPGFDVTWFNVDYWQKYERMLAYARERDVMVSVIFYVDGAKPGVDPFKGRAGEEDEQRYYRYAAARLSAYSNVMWDVTNEYHLFRDEEWVNKMGPLLKEADPYDHLTSVHADGKFRFRTQPWADYAMYQSWDEHGGYGFMLKNRRVQEETGRPIPQVNEEYGYEDHYPRGWGGDRVSPARSGDNRRRLAWEMAMAGGYQTTGERADTGTGWGPDTGGGWINGRGDDSMTMLVGYGYMVDFFTGFEWWKTEPRPDLVTGENALCLAEPGRQYVLYLKDGGSATLQLEPGSYNAVRYSPRTGESEALGTVEGGAWTSPQPSDDGDWAFLLTRKEMN